MFKPSDLKIDHKARELCRKLRKNQTPAESLFWERVRSRRFKGLKFYRQYPIFYEFNNRESFFIADFICIQYRIVIEIDGKIHDFKSRIDSERTEVLKYLGLDVYRIKNRDIELDTSKVLNELSKYIKNHKKKLG